MPRNRARQLSVIALACAAVVTLGTTGCTDAGAPASPAPSTGAVAEATLARDASSAIDSVATIPGVVATHLTYSQAKLGYAASISGTVAVTSGADPVDVLERVLFQLYRGARVGTYVVATTRDGQLWDTENLGLSSAVSRAALVSRYGEGQAAATLPTTLPTTLPPRPAPTSRPVPGTPATP